MAKYLMDVAVLLACLVGVSFACTNYLVSKGATVEGHTRISYAADDGGLYGSLGFYPAATHAPGTMRKIWDWDTAYYYGSIPEAPTTYSVVGNMNEHGLTIAETTFGGLQILSKQPGAIMDYGSLIWVTLQRAKTAREAIQVMGNLTAEYGYASSGESFSIGDSDEVWVLEMIGKGAFEKGSVWVAHKIPDGYVSGHANQARIRTFPRDDPDTAIYSNDVYSFAVKQGLYPSTAPEADFSFSDTYDPVGFAGARFCEVRVWGFFEQVVPGMEEYLDYVQGQNLTNRMPLYVKPTKLISLNDTMWHMRTHFEGTWFDNRGLPDARQDVGAGAFNSPYRWRPLEWTSGSKSYVNERTVGIQQTGWHFVAEMRPNMPGPLSGVLWFGVDDTSKSVHFPIYGGVTRIPAAYGDRYGQVPGAAVPYGAQASILEFSFDSAWWVFNMVANFAYQRHGPINEDIASMIVTLEKEFMSSIEEMDKTAMAEWTKDSAQAIETVTAFCEKTGNNLVASWLGVWKQLFVKYRDGFVVSPSAVPVCPEGQTTNCTSRPVAVVGTAGYPADWYGRIVTENGAHYAVPATETEDKKFATLPKLKLRGV